MLALPVERELPAADLLEAGLAGLAADLAQHRGIQRGVRRLAIRAGPKFPFRHYA